MINYQKIKIDKSNFLFDSITVFYTDEFIPIRIIWGEDVEFIDKLKRNYDLFEDTGSNKIITELTNYFNGKSFEIDLKMDFEHKIFRSFNKPTKWQVNVWQAATQIPYGNTVSYSELAIKIGKPRNSRAVGNALGRNPLAIIVPCHRVIALKSLGGFTSPKGVDHKHAILEFEKNVLINLKRQ